LFPTTNPIANEDFDSQAKTLGNTSANLCLLAVIKSYSWYNQTSLHNKKRVLAKHGTGGPQQAKANK